MQRTNQSPFKVHYPRRVRDQTWVFRLVNKGTGRLSSSTNWLVDLAAVALTLGHRSGIASILPLYKAENLLRHNKLKKFNRQKRQDEDSFFVSDSTYRKRLQEAFPLIKTYFVATVTSRSHKEVNRKQFISWLTEEIKSTNSQLCKILEAGGYKELVGGNYGQNWWKKQLRASTLMGGKK